VWRALGGRWRTTYRVGPSIPEEQERQDDAEGQINFGDAASYCPEAGSLLPGNPPEGAKNSDDEGNGRNPRENHTPKEPLCLGVIVHSGERVSQCREKIRQRLRSVLLPQDADIPLRFM
jgi:hypothetical protein